MRRYSFNPKNSQPFIHFHFPGDLDGKDPSYSSDKPPSPQPHPPSKKKRKKRKKKKYHTLVNSSLLMPIWL